MDLFKFPLVNEVEGAGVALGKAGILVLELVLVRFGYVGLAGFDLVILHHQHGYLLLQIEQSEGLSQLGLRRVRVLAPVRISDAEGFEKRYSFRMEVF